MNCPACRQPITIRSNHCPYCQHGFDPDTMTRLHAVLDIREQLAYLESLQDYLARSISLIGQRLATLEAAADAPAPKVAEAGIRTPAPDPTQADTEYFDATESITVTGTVPTPAQTTGEPSVTGTRSGTKLDGEIQFGQKWLLVIGIITTVFAVAYFLKYSFSRGWVGPTGRVMLSFLAGVSFLGTGELCFRRQWERFGLYLVGGGIAVLYFSVFAAFQMYHLFPHWLAFLVMVLITAFAGVFAMVRNTRGLAILGIIGGFGTPILLATGVDNQMGLMTYMLILNAGIVWLASRKEWSLLESLGFVFTWLLFIAWYAEHYTPDRFALTMGFMTLFFLVYAVIPVAPALFRDLAVPVRQLWYMGPNALLAFGFSVAMIKPKYGLAYVSVVTIAYAALFLFMASLMTHDTVRHREGFWYLTGNTVFFLLVTIPVLFSGEWISVFWALEAGALLWFGRKLERPWMTYGSLILLAFVLTKLVAYDYPIVFHLTAPPVHFRDGFGTELLSRWTTGGVVLGVIWWFRRRLLADPRVGHSLATICTAVFGGALFLLLTWETAALFNDTAPAATFAAISVLWTAFAAIVMAQGFRKPSATLRRTAIGLFLVTLAKVFLFDIARFSTPFRILSFLVLGLLLIASSWLYYRFRDHLLKPTGKEKQA